MWSANLSCQACQRRAAFDPSWTRYVESVSDVADVGADEGPAAGEGELSPAGRSATRLLRARLSPGAPLGPTPASMPDPGRRQPIEGPRLMPSVPGELKVPRARSADSSRAWGRRASSGGRVLAPRSKRARPGLGTTAFGLVPRLAALSQRRRSTHPSRTASALVVVTIVFAQENASARRLVDSVRAAPSIDPSGAYP
jgi:hypothetical protein